MNIQEACQILNVPIGASESDVKSAFKKKAIEYHPDRNKSSDAEDKFKQINAAYQLLEKHGTSPPVVHDVSSVFFDPSEMFADELRKQMENVFKNKINSTPPLVVSVKISFEESVLGCKKEFNYSRLVMCACINNQTCTKCNGSGTRKYGMSGSDGRELPCTNCQGTGKLFRNYASSCNQCKGQGKYKETKTLTITIPPGTSGQLIIPQKGNYNPLIKAYEDLIVKVFVEENTKGLSLHGQDVISTVDLTLLESLKGTKKLLVTVKGEKSLEFKPKIKNGDRIRVSGFGVPPNGAHIFIVNVIYPDDVSELINCLEKV